MKAESQHVNIVVTGANGFVGRALLQEAVARGLTLRGITRAPCDLGPSIENHVVGEINESTDWDQALKGCETVIHLAARVHVMQDTEPDPLAAFRRINVAGTERLARDAARHGVKRLVYVSSIKVNGEETTDTHRYTESDVPAPQDAYGQSKLEAEQVLHQISRETGMEVVIVRPPLVYGPAVKGNFELLLKVAAKGWPLPFASVDNQRSLIYVGNLVDALLCCATHPAAAGQTYLVRDGEDLSTAKLLRGLSVALNVPSRLIPCPPALLRLAGNLTGRREQLKRLLGCLRVDDGKIRQELTWLPPYSTGQGLQAVAQWRRNKNT